MIAAQAFNVLSGSMEPTLQIDDKFIVDKVSYHFSQPKRGDIVVFSPTRNFRKNNTTMLLLNV
ncbi:leader peptidase I [Tolypothrix sp. NIES-4075]|nr:leader peptidase I [Tolypothrix sp. NIES-4075]